MHALRRTGLAHTALSRACAHTIRLRLLKLGAVVRVSVRRVKLAMSEACPNQRWRRGALSRPHEPECTHLNH